MSWTFQDCLGYQRLRSKDYCVALSHIVFNFIDLCLTQLRHSPLWPLLSSQFSFEEEFIELLSYLNVGFVGFEHSCQQVIVWLTHPENSQEDQNYSYSHLVVNWELLISSWEIFKKSFHFLYKLLRIHFLWIEIIPSYYFLF